MDNGPGWVGVLLPSARAVLELDPDLAAFGDLEIGVIGRHAPEHARVGETGDGADVEVRAFVPSLGIGEDPVTGSLNAGLAHWLAGGDWLPTSYVAAQGTAIGRRGRVHITVEDDDPGQDGERTVWVAGDTLTTITGEVRIAGPARR